LAGDFNYALKPVDRKTTRSSGLFADPVASLNTLIKSNKLLDIWRELNQNKQQFTWRRKDKSQSSRIDMILIGKDFQSIIQSCKIYPAVIQTTDHQGVLLAFSTGVPEKGNGFWKLNNSVLKDEEYKFIINKLIERQLTSINKENNYDIRLMWNVLKIEIKDLTIAYCKNKSKKNKGDKTKVRKRSRK